MIFLSIIFFFFFFTAMINYEGLTFIYQGVIIFSWRIIPRYNYNKKLWNFLEQF